MQNKHWIVEGWNNMWQDNGGPIVIICILSFLLLLFLKPIWVAIMIIGFFVTVVLVGLYKIFISPFVKAFINRNK